MIECFIIRKLYNIYYIREMTQLFEIKVNLSENQKKNISDAYQKRETIVIRLTNDSLSGSDTLFVPATVKRLEKNRKENKGMDIKLPKTNIRKQVGGSILTSALSLACAFGPTIAKTLGLSALAGLASEGASQVVKKISGNGTQKGGFLIPQNKIDKLIANKHLLTAKQKRDILDALQSGSGVVIKPTIKQSGGFLRTLLASIGIPMVLKALTGSGLHVEKSRPKRSIPVYVPPKQGKGKNKRMITYQQPPFIGNWKNPIGLGIKKKKAAKKKGKGILLGPNSPFNKIPLLGAIL